MSCIKEWKISIHGQKIRGDNSGATMAAWHCLIFWIWILILPSLIQWFFFYYFCTKKYVYIPAMRTPEELVLAISVLGQN